MPGAWAATRTASPHGVDVPQRPERRDTEPGQAFELAGAGVGTGHRDASQPPRVGVAQAEQPEPAVGGGPVHRVAVAETPARVGEHPGCHLRRVHADQYGGPADVREGVREPFVEARTALGDDLDPARQPRAGPSLQRDHVTRRGSRDDGVERVGERGLGDERGLPGRVRRAEPGLHAARHRLLGDDEEREAHVPSFTGRARVLIASPPSFAGTRPRIGSPASLTHEASRTRRMSRTAWSVPRTVPVTFDRPVRGW